MKITKTTTANSDDRMMLVQKAFNMLDSEEGKTNILRIMRIMKDNGFDASIAEMREIAEWIDAAYRVAGLQKIGASIRVDPMQA